jgi:hypothetical protein
MNTVGELGCYISRQKAVASGLLGPEELHVDHGLLPFIF